MGKPRLSRGERGLLLVTTLFVLIAGGVWYRWHVINIDPVVTIPTPTMPTPNARDTYLDAAQMMVGSLTPTGTSLDDMYDFIRDRKFVSPSAKPSGRTAPMLAEMPALMRKNAPVFARVRQGLAQDFRQTPVRSFSQRTPENGKFRQLAKAMLVDGYVQCATGDWDGGVDRFIDVIELGTDIQHGGNALACLAGVWSEGVGWQEIWGTVDHLDGVAAARAAHRLEGIIASRVPYHEIMQEDEWTTQAALLEIFRNPHWRKELYRDVTSSLGLDVVASDNGPSKYIMAIQNYTVSKRAMMREVTVYMDALIANAKRPYPQCLKTPPLPRNPFCQLLVSWKDSGYTYLALNDVQNDLLLLSFALRAYQADHGVYPPTLQALVPAYLQALPTDPFTAGKPLHYRPTGKSYLLYSVGPDARDNGGKASKDGRAGTSDSSIDCFSTGDIVAGVNVQ